MMIKMIVSTSFLIGVSLLNLDSVKEAYIDPNTGGMLFQILAVLFGAITGALLLFSGKIKGFYYRLRRRVRNSEENSVDESSHQEGDGS